MKSYKKRTVVKILELGEYSMVVNLKIPDIKVFMIMSREQHWATEIIPSENGCIVYFDEPAGKFFEKGQHYLVYISNASDTYWALTGGLIIFTPTRNLSLIPPVT